METLEEQLQKLEAAYYSGASRTRYAEIEVWLRPGEDLWKAIQRLKKQLGKATPRVKTIQSDYEKGL